MASTVDVSDTAVRNQRRDRFFTAAHPDIDKRSIRPMYLLQGSRLWDTLVEQTVLARIIPPAHVPLLWPLVGLGQLTDMTEFRA